MRDEALIPLTHGKTATYQRYDWSTDRLLEWETIKPTETVLVEGVYSSRPELRPMLDATIFIEAPRVERIRRIKSRNPNEPINWLTPWLSAEGHYLTQIRPQGTADLILPSSE
jgi:uridine kinase